MKSSNNEIGSTIDRVFRGFSRFSGLLAIIWLVSGCSDPVQSNPAPPKGTATLRFSATSSVRKNAALVDPLKGSVYGELYLSEDVSLTGPREGSPAFATIELPVDLDAADPSEAIWTSEPLDLNRYVFLGMLDVDGNKVEKDGPDPGDPVTLPITNQFDVTENQTTDVTVLFELVYN